MSQIKILLVDDEELLRLTISSDLQDAGYEVDTAADGQEAYLCLAQKTYDLIITDLLMEGIDGMQVMEEARRLDPMCSIILLTGHGNVESVVEALRGGADDYLLKPYKHEELFFRLTRCMEKRTLRVELKEAERKLRKSHDDLEKKVQKRTVELQLKNQEIFDSNTTLRVLLEQHEKSKEEIEETISTNLKENVLPYLDLLKEEVKDRKGSAYATIIETNIRKITSTFSKQLSSVLLNLTPREMQVANFVRQGRTTKDIAELLTLTPGTVEFYRLNLRKKLGINSKKVNLRTYLLSFPTT